MPNLYVTPTEIKAVAPDGIRDTTIKYGGLLLRLANEVSRFIDRHCRRAFHPRYGERLFHGPTFRPHDELWIDDLLEIASISVSSDQGATYTALAATDYIATVAGDYNDRRSYTLLEIDPNGDYSAWPSGHKAIKISGWWGFADDRDLCWDDSGLDLAANALAGAASLAVADANAADRWGIGPAIHAGRLARVANELIEVTGITNNQGAVNDTLAVLGSRNGTTAAAHNLGDAVLIWRAPDPVRNAATIQAVRQMERGFQGFGDARATAEIGQAVFVRALDPEAKALLAPYVKMAI